jgi:hypothetical protein
MTRRLVLVLTMMAVLASPAVAQRGGNRGNRTVQTPYGPVFNPTLSPEWRQAGGNPMVYQQIMRQRQMLAQQKAMQGQAKAMQKQQDAFNKWYSEQKAKRDKGEPTDAAFERMFGKTKANAQGEGEGDAPAEAKAPTRKTKAQFRAEMRKKAEAQKAGLDGGVKPGATGTDGSEAPPR